MGQVPAPHSFCQYFTPTMFPTFKLHRAHAQVFTSAVIPGLLACTGRWGLECLTWCPNFEALYFRNKAEKQENGRRKQPLQAVMPCLAPANSTWSGDSGKKKSAPFGEVVAKLCSIKDERCSGCTQALAEASQKCPPRRPPPPPTHVKSLHPLERSNTLLCSKLESVRWPVQCMRTSQRGSCQMGAADVNSQAQDIRPTASAALLHPCETHIQDIYNEIAFLSCALLPQLARRQELCALRTSELRNWEGTFRTTCARCLELDFPAHVAVQSLRSCTYAKSINASVRLTSAAVRPSTSLHEIPSWRDSLRQSALESFTCRLKGSLRPPLLRKLVAV